MALVVAAPKGGCSLQLWGQCSNRFSSSSRRSTIVMAVPKKRTSKMKKRIRHAVWMQKARRAADKALSLAKSVLTGRSNSFYYETDESPAPKCTAGDYAFTEEGEEEEKGITEEPRVGDAGRNSVQFGIVVQYMARMLMTLALWIKVQRKQLFAKSFRLVLLKGLWHFGKHSGKNGPTLSTGGTFA